MKPTTDQDVIDAIRRHGASELEVAEGFRAIELATAALAPILPLWVRVSFPPPAGTVPVARVEFFEAGPFIVVHLRAATPRASVPAANGSERVLAQYDRDVAELPGRPLFILCYRQYDSAVAVPSDAVSLPLADPSLTFNMVCLEQTGDQAAAAYEPPGNVLLLGDGTLLLLCRRRSP